MQPIASIQLTLDDQVIRRIARHIAEYQRISGPQADLPWQDWMDDFLAALAEGPILQAAERVPVSRATVYKYRKRCLPFRKEWDSIVTCPRRRPRRRRARRQGGPAGPARDPELLVTRLLE